MERELNATERDDLPTQAGSGGGPHPGWERQEQQRSGRLKQESQDEPIEAAVEPSDMAGLESDPRAREAVHQLPERCHEMIGMLFCADPPMPYRDVASRLGLVAGSIGFNRGRCLRKLQKLLESEGLA